MFRILNASEIEPEALADFRLIDFGDRLVLVLRIRWPEFCKFNFVLIAS